MPSEIEGSVMNDILCVIMITNIIGYGQDKITKNSSSI